MRSSVRSIAPSRSFAYRSRSLSPFVCSQCQRAAAQTSLALGFSQQRQASSNDKLKEKLHYTERFRRKMWGTDNPPGQKDPYNQASPEEMEQLYEQEAKLQEEEAMAAEAKRLAAEEKRAKRKGNISKKELQEPEIVDPESTDRELVEQLGHRLPAGAALRTVNPDDIDAESIRAVTGEELDALGYEAAETWNGLARIGGKETLAQKKQWQAENPYHPFIPSKEVPGHLCEGLVQRALCEVLTLKEVNLPLTNASFAPLHTSCDYDTATIEPNGNGYTLNYSDESFRQEILQSMIPQDATEFEVEQYEEVAPSYAHLDVAVGETKPNASWHQVRLDADLPLKFALLRRTMQLTGRRVHDPIINSFNTVGDIVAHLRAKPKPTKIYDILMANRELQELPNVQIRPNKYTAIGKDMEFGRHKLVVAELAKRGLRPNGKDLKVEVNVFDAEEGIENMESVAAGR